MMNSSTSKVTCANGMNHSSFTYLLPEVYSIELCTLIAMFRHFSFYLIFGLFGVGVTWTSARGEEKPNPIV